jgi:Protein of unknown function (DUF1275)
LEAIRLASLRPLLLLQFFLLASFLGICLAAGPHVDPHAAIAVVGAMLGVSAMAVQNALVRVSLKDAPSTAVMTTNITLLTIDVGDLLLARDAHSVAKAQTRQTPPKLSASMPKGGCAQAMFLRECTRTSPSFCCRRWRHRFRSLCSRPMRVTRSPIAALTAPERLALEPGPEDEIVAARSCG